MGNTILSKFENMKLRRKLTIAMGGILLISMGVLILFSTYSFRKSAVKSAMKMADITAEHYGGHIESKINYTIANVKLLSELFEEYELFPEENRREYFTKEMKKISEKNKDFLSVWVIAEPNAIDNLDSQFAGKDGNTELGRFVAGWYRENNELKISDGTEEEILSEDYYKLPKEKKVPIIMEPYFDSYYDNAPEILMTSIIFPVIKNGEYKGCVGIDISLEFFKDYLKEVKPFETGSTAVFSNLGNCLYSEKAEEIGKNIKEISKEIEEKK